MPIPPPCLQHRPPRCVRVVQPSAVHFVLLLSEIFPKKLNVFSHVDAWVQIACPRLSVDWGHFFTKPVLSAYELNVALGEEKWREVYPMDFYKAGSGRWSNYHDDNRNRVIHNEA